jgi:hypothetical protein
MAAPAWPVLSGSGSVASSVGWTAPGLDDTSWLLWLMFVSVRLLVDYGSERPTRCVRPLTASVAA